jgi:cytoskeletal protein RodZ
VGVFGDKFRKEREKKGFSLDDVSKVTKISSRMLQAIEQEHFDQLPGGVFNKGFIRAYAKHVGLNDEEAVTDYLACLRQAQIDANEVWEPQRPAPPPRPAPPQNRPANKRRLTRQPEAPLPGTRVGELPDLQLPRAEDVRPPRKNYGQPRPEIPWRIVAVAALAVVLVIILWIRHSRSEAASASPFASQPASPSKTSPPAQPPSASLTSPANQASAPPVVKAPTHPPSPKSQPPQANDAAAHTSTPAPATPPPDAQGSDVTIRNLSPANPSSLTKSVLPSSTPAAAAKATENKPITLIIRASETSWISVSADGQPVSIETLIAPAHTSVRADREIVAKIGNAAGVSFLWNGQEIPAQGAESEVKTFVFDASGMRVVPSTQ